MSAFSNIMFQIAVMFILIMCGYILFRKKYISYKTNEEIANLVISIVNPALMFYSYNTELKKTLIVGLGQAFIIAVLMHLLFIGISRMVIPKKDNQQYGLERYCCIYSNCAFIGIPLVSSVYGSEGVFYITAYITVFNLLMWSHGIMLLSREEHFNFVKKVLLSPTIIATLSGMLIFFLQIKLPAILLKPVYYIGSMNTPLAMIVAGATIAQSDFLKILKNARVYLIILVKLLLVPALMILVLSFVTLNHTAFMATVLVGACPVATASTLLAIRYRLDARYASQIFGITTLISAFTLPILVVIGEMTS